MVVELLALYVGGNERQGAEDECERGDGDDGGHEFSRG
jgi:hypothetical protein